MIKEAYCSFEIAKLLKEKGFNEKCRGGYHCEFDDNDNSIVMFEEWMTQPYNNDFVDEGFLCSAPTHQMAMAWLREVYDIFIDIGYDDLDWYWLIESISKDIPIEDRPKLIKNGTACHKTYEDAVEAALKYLLENLI